MKRYRAEFVKIAELPSHVEISESSRKRIRDVLEHFDFSNILFLTGKTSYNVAGAKIEEKIVDLIAEKIFISNASMDEVRNIEIAVGYADIDAVLGVGGGKVLDVGKVIASEINVAFISIPTVASHDGIASPVASFKEKGKPVSISTRPPTAVLADLTILRKSPVRFLRSGFGDLISNITAVKDWKLANDKVGEDYNEVAASMAVLPSRLMLNLESIDFRDLTTLEMLVRGLILSGVAISIVGRSRPASGAEHKFSHALDYLGYGNALHGEQVGIGAIVIEYLHQKYYGIGDWEAVKNALEKAQAPTKAKEIGLTKEQIIEALIYAKRIRRRRYTILEDVNPNKDEFEIVLEKTGIC